MSIQTRHPVSEHATAELVGTDRWTTLRDAARVMHDSDIGALAVNDGATLVGVFAERDLLRAAAAGEDLDAATVGSWMSVPPVTARPDDPVLDVALMMLDRWIRHVPLVDGFGRERGMVSLRDLLRPLLLQAMTPPERIDASGDPSAQR